MTLEHENRLVLLLSIMELGGQPSKAKTLDHIEQEGYIEISPSDKRALSNGEQAWRNRLAWIRKNLVMDGALSDYYHNVWAITETGKREFTEIVREARTAGQLQRVTGRALSRATQLVGNTL